MPIKVIWENHEKDIIHLQREAQVTEDNYYTSLETLVKMMKTVRHPVDVIYMHSGNISLERGSLLNHVRYALVIMPKNSRLHLFVKPSLETMAVLKALKRSLAPRRMKNILVVENLEDAHQVIRNQISAQFG